MRHQSALIKRLLVPQTPGARMHIRGSIWPANTEKAGFLQAIRPYLGFLSGERLWELLLTGDLKCLLSVELSIKL